MPVVRRSLRALALCAASVVLSTALPATAAAEQGDGWARHPKVGYIEGWYLPVDGRDDTSDRDYRGNAYPYLDQCVVAERKLRSGGWTDSFVDQGGDCGIVLHWSITNDTAVANTVAIRLRVLRGVNAPGSFVNLCNTKAQCLAMRY